VLLLIARCVCTDGAGRMHRGGLRLSGGSMVGMGVPGKGVKARDDERTAGWYTHRIHMDGQTRPLGSSR
jgi:hypothetical protein